MPAVSKSTVPTRRSREQRLLRVHVLDAHDARLLGRLGQDPVPDVQALARDHVARRPALDQADEHQHDQGDHADDDREPGAEDQQAEHHEHGHDQRAHDVEAHDAAPRRVAVEHLLLAGMQVHAGTLPVRRRRARRRPPPWSPHSGVAQWQSIRLLIEGLWVRVPPPESRTPALQRAFVVLGYQFLVRGPCDAAGSAVCRGLRLQFRPEDRPALYGGPPAFPYHPATAPGGSTYGPGTIPGGSP